LEDVTRAIVLLEDELPREYDPIISWFTNTYIGAPRNNGTRSAPLFGYEIWGVQQRTLLAKNRTNNFSEACHKKIQLGFGSSHPSIFKFIEGTKIFRNVIKNS